MMTIFLESISLAIYSACLLEHERRVEFISAFEKLLNHNFDTPNVLIRDSIRLLGNLLEDVGLSPEVAKRMNSFPERAPAPSAWPTLDNAKPLLEIENLPLNMKLWGSNLGPDFWRYQVEPRMGNFDLESAGISWENIACWIMVEALKLGYPGTEGCALHTDRAIISEFGSGRSRKGYADRLGKKYYWILFHQLIGILADNVAAKMDPFSNRVPSSKHLWSVDVRKVDLTDIRDITPEIEYPDELLRGPRYVFPDQASDITHWVCTNDFTSHQECIVRVSQKGDEWVALSFGARDSDRTPKEAFNAPYLKVDVFYSIIFIDKNISTVRRDVFDGSGAYCYRGYLAEYQDSLVCDQNAGDGDFYSGDNGIEFSEVRLLRSGECNYDYSYISHDRQDHLSVPCRDVVRVLKLKLDKQRGRIDKSGKLISFESKIDFRDGLFIRRCSLDDYLVATERKLVYRCFANRCFFTDYGRGGMQIDLITLLGYYRKGRLKLISHEANPFNCECGQINQKS